ncbi:hypothetical protein I302_106324 [Kwoniella bestiolae CBS 10118]|uniref:Exonuclease domain-containing protein n=1 Tax=Kwoniella bestiolae CBS 10118 TaxID=1296100 RepID=A0A1B9G3J5_9TREE|nr:hypothetical protein I302_05448 [Kwoniella bestiolae CBS 10118]OCF25627.1 hypothetical protein I302_05448 [Kwoniella bestiolae CBS 10118]
MTSKYTLPDLNDYLAIDCEFVGCRSGQALAKVGIVNHEGSIILDTYVFVHPENIVDYRTSTSGIKPGDLDGAPTYEQVTSHIKSLLKDKILLGHTIFNDLSGIGHKHPYESFRDTALYCPLRRRMGIMREGEFPSLKKLAKAVLGRDIQVQDGRGHDPIEDARATMAIFLSVREEYEIALLEHRDCISGIPP